LKREKLFFERIFYSFGLSEFAVQTYHLDGRNGCFISLVSIDASGAVESLLHIVGCEQAENYRDFSGEVQFGDTLTHALANIVEVGRVASYHASERDNGVNVAFIDQQGSSEGEFETSGDMNDGYLVGGGTFTDKRLESAVEQGFRNLRVPFGDYDSETHRSRIVVAVDEIIR
jgi:hypothetical protein